MEQQQHSCRKKTVFYQNWFDPGITIISDLLKQQGDFLELHDFALKFHLNVPFTKYYGLVAAIPKLWKANLENPTPTVERSNTANILTTRNIYSSLLKSVFVPPSLIHITLSR